MNRAFDKYRTRVGALGSNYREANYKQSIAQMEYSFEDSINYRLVYVDGIKYDARLIIDSKNTYKSGIGSYMIQFRHDVKIPAGKYVYISNPDGVLEENCPPWLMISNSEEALFPKHVIHQCNYCIRWVDTKGKVHERWAVFDDSYKVYGGERMYADNRLTLPDFTLVCVVPNDPNTADVDRDIRLIVDSYDINNAPDTFIVSNRNTTSKIYRGNGVITWALSQRQFDATTDGLACYIANCRQYDFCTGDCISCEYRIREIERPEIIIKDLDILYKGKAEILLGSKAKEFSLEADDSIAQISWQVTCPEEMESSIVYETVDNKLYVSVPRNTGFIGSFIRITCEYTDINDNTNSKDLVIKVVSGI